MQLTQKQDQKINNKKLYTSPSAANFSYKHRNQYQNSYASKPGMVRRTQNGDDKYSQISNSQIHHRNGYVQGRPSQQEIEYAANQSRFSKNTRGHSQNAYKVLSEKQQNVIQLRQRLKNIHHFYRIRIQQQRTKNIERNQIFIAIIEQLQKTHNDKVVMLQKSIEQLQNDKRQIDIVDQRMISMQDKIQDILKGSQELKQKNQRTQKKILQKQLGVKEKQTQYMRVKEEVTTLRDKLEQFERLKLKQNKRTRQLMEMIQHIS